MTTATGLALAELQSIHCANCNIHFAMPLALYRRCQADSTRQFYCPNGHNNIFSESEADKLRRERNRLAQQIAQKDEEIATRKRWQLEAEARADASERRRIAATGQVTRLKKRAAIGQCPCCEQKFVDLWGHMRRQHPSFVAEPVDDGAQRLLMAPGGKAAR